MFLNAQTPGRRCGALAVTRDVAGGQAALVYLQNALDAT